MREIIDYITDSVWYNAIALFAVPIAIIGGFNSPYEKYIYWMLASLLFMTVIINFFEAIIRKIEDKMEVKL